MTRLFWRALCFLNLYHDWRAGYCDDGKGNTGGAEWCRTCGKTYDPYL